MQTENYISKNSILECSCGCGLKPQNSALWFLESLARQYHVLFNKDLVVSSGARCFRHNAEVGGVANSAHIKGLAFDVLYSNSRECYEIIKYLFAMGIKRIGINFNKNFIHFDIDSSLPQEVLFKY